MIEIFLYISNGLIIFSFISYILLIFVGRTNQISKSDGFDITKDIISEYNSINVIESSGYFTIYNIKRRVIKLATKCYYGKDLSSISLSLMEAGISVVDNNNNKIIDMLRSLILNLKILYIFPVLALFINNSTYNVNDAKTSLLFVLFFSFVSYFLINIKSDASLWVSENLKKIKTVSNDNCLKIINFMNKLLLLDKFIYFGELLMIIRFLLIMLEIGY